MMFDLVVHSKGPLKGDLLEMFYDDLVSVESGTRKNPDGTYPKVKDQVQETRFRFIGEVWRAADAHAQAAKRGLLTHVEPV